MRRSLSSAAPAVLLLSLALGACDGSPVDPDPQPASISVTPARVEVVVGEQASIGAQVLDGDGRVMSAASVVYSVDRPSVAFVSPTGVVTAVSPGSATVTASHGALSASVPVTVAAETRGFLRTLDILPAEVSLDNRNPAPTYVEFRAYNGFGQSICDKVTFSLRSDRSVATAHNRSASATDCIFQISPAGPGDTYVVASANGVSDSVRVTVTSTGYNAFWLGSPATPELRAGATVAYEVKVVDPSGAPVAGRTVGFEASAGTLDASRVTTDANGVARVRWTLPARFNEMGNYYNLSFRTQLPNGMVDTETRWVSVNADTPTRVTLYYRHGSGSFEPADSVVRAPLGQTMYLVAIATDRHGNHSMTPPTFTASDPLVMTHQNWGSYYAGQALPLVNYTYYHQMAYLYSSTARTATLTAGYPGGPSRSVRVVFGNP